MLKQALALAALTFSLNASAAVVKWEFVDVVFDDGGTAYGSFKYNTETYALTEIDIHTTAGDKLGARHFIATAGAWGSRPEIGFLAFTDTLSTDYEGAGFFGINANLDPVQLPELPIIPPIDPVIPDPLPPEETPLPEEPIVVPLSSEPQAVDLTLLITGGESFCINTNCSSAANDITDPELSRDIISGSLVAVSSVPVPAAAWLFGSAIIGLVGIKRRK